MIGNKTAVETFLPGQEFLAKIRYNHSGAPCKILEVGNDWLRLEFLEPQRGKLGGEIITIGSDAHSPKQVARNFKQAEELLKEAGFRYY